MSHKRKHCKSSSSQSTCKPSSTNSTCTFSTATDSTCDPSTCSSTNTRSTTCYTSSNTTCNTNSSSTCGSTCPSSSTCATDTSCSSLTSECCESSSSCESSMSSTSGSDYSSGCCPEPLDILGKKKFKVSFGKKCGHRYEHQISGDSCIYINGSVAPILKVQRGYEYYFNVKQDQCNGDYKNLFVLTDSPIGEYNGCPPEPLKGSFSPVGSGCVKYFVDCHTPKYFYYQNANASFQGGLVLVTDC